jgi:fumarate hydratase class II
MARFRQEGDSMGTVRVPVDAYYGCQTQRAADNFPISGLRLQAAFINSLALIKLCAADVNRSLDLLAPDTAAAIAQAAREIRGGALHDQFVIDVFQTGSGTSTNMNMNEVIASRANEILTGARGGRFPVHPNDHVNMGQSSNDVIPSVMHIAAREQIQHRLVPALTALKTVLEEKTVAFSDVRKIGRTHLQDAVPITLGQEFSGYARQIELGVSRLASADIRLAELAIGGTAVGTGINTHPNFGDRMASAVSDATGLAFVEAVNHFEAQGARDAAVETSGALRTIAGSLVKIANDIRWLGSGPRCGIGEIVLPSLQPGSSIMPGKVNPVIPEAVIQVAAQVVGNDTTIAISGQSGNFELNVMLPVMAYNLLQSIDLLASAAEVFATKCIAGISADRKRCAGYIERSLALATGLVPHIGYDKAAEIAKKAHTTGRTVPDIARSEKVLPDDMLDRLFALD